jgi:RNA polymerase sigma factor for flagellar operon FliA
MNASNENAIFEALETEKQRETGRDACGISFKGKKAKQGRGVARQAKNHALLERRTTGLEVVDLMPFVRSIARKIHQNQPPGVILNDLVQDGMIGLIKAFREYDAALGVPLIAYAKQKITWAIMDGLRSDDWADKNVRGRANKVSKAAHQLQATLHRKPTHKEIAVTIGVSADEVTQTLGEAYGLSFVRINDDIDGETQDIPDSRMEPCAIVERREAYRRAVDGLKILYPNERKAFILRILCDMSGDQAAAEMGVTASRVSQLYKTATEKLASYV